MVSKKEALTASFGSALVVGAAHWGAHQYFGTGPDAVIKVGATVVIFTFAFAYWGMRRSK